MKNILHSSFFRLISIALFSAILFSFSFFLSSASAETSNSGALDLSGFQIGKLGDYPVISDIYNLDLIKSYLSTSSSNSSSHLWDSFLPFVIFDNKIYYADKLSYIQYYQSYWDSKRSITFSFGGSASFNPITAPVDFSNSSYAYDYRNYSYSVNGTTFTFLNSYYPSDRYTCTFNMTASDGTVLPSDGNYTFYFARVSSSKSSISFSSISSKLSSLSFSLDQSAKFLKLVDSSSDSKLNICDWMRAGFQYPIVDFQINDNNYMDSYILKVGSNSTKTDLMQQLYQEEQVKNGLSAALNFSGSAIGINIRRDNSAINNLKVLLALTTCDTWDYDTVTTISSDLFTFSDPDVLSSIYSVNLSDYLSIVPYNIYRLDIVSKSSAKILATCYFTSERAYSRGNSGYGVKQYSYGSVSDANSDSSSNDYAGKPPTVTGNIADSTNVSDFVSQNFNNNLSNLDISSTFGSFENALNSVSSFFQACWGLFPPAIWAIILCGITLIVVLRVLGR